MRGIDSALVLIQLHFEVTAAPLSLLKIPFVKVMLIQWTLVAPQPVLNIWKGLFK